MSKNLPRSSKRESIIVGVIIAAIALGLLSLWRSQNDPRVAELNRMLMADPEIHDFSYPFRVLAVKGDTAYVSSPRSPQVSVLHFLAIDQPQLDLSNPDSPSVIAAQKALARVQGKVHKRVLSHPGIDKVQWTLDKAWYLQHGVDIR